MRSNALIFLILISSVAPANNRHWQDAKVAKIDSEAGGTNPLPAAGMMPYTPTRLEWLELNLEACYREEGIRVGVTPAGTDLGAEYSVNFIAKPPDTIEIVLQYSKRTRAGLVDKAIEHYKRMVEKDASSRGWSWVKIEVQRDLSE